MKKFIETTKNKALKKGFTPHTGLSCRVKHDGQAPKAIARQNPCEGFTMIETLVAITILLISVVAPMSLAQDGITAAGLAADQIVAFYLAQEGIELVKNLREENRLNNRNQLDVELADCKVDPTTDETGCTIDSTVTLGGKYVAYDCPAEACPAINFQDFVGGGNRYTHENGINTQPSKFTRDIRVWYQDLTEADKTEAVVEVEVTWEFRNSTKSHKIRNHMLNW